MIAVPFFGFALGTLFAWLGRDDLSRGATSRVAAHSLLVVLLYAAFVFAPACAYFLVFEPDWANAYLVEAGSRARLVDVGGTLVCTASVPVGFAFATRPARALRGGHVLRLGAPAALVGLALLLALFPRLAVRATFAQYHGDFGTEPVKGSPLGWALVWFGLIVSAGTAYTLKTLHELRR